MLFFSSNIMLFFSFSFFFSVFFEPAYSCTHTVCTSALVFGIQAAMELCTNEILKQWVRKKKKWFYSILDFLRKPVLPAKDKVNPLNPFHTSKHMLQNTANTCRPVWKQV